MGRSVSYPPGAIVAFDHLDRAEDDPDLDMIFWSDYTDDLRATACKLWPSLAPADRWLDREDRVLAENAHAHFGISEYCGLVAIWLVVRGDADHPELAEQWAASVEPQFRKTFGTLRKIGTASNGESFFEYIEREATHAA